MEEQVEASALNSTKSLKKWPAIEPAALSKTGIFSVFVLLHA
jgi:hypothetical protein